MLNKRDRRGTLKEKKAMGIFNKVADFARSQFIEVIEWLDESHDTLVYRFPVQGQEIKNGAQLIVRESQAAVFVHEGQVADTFGPGRYTVDGGNTPVLSKLGAWYHGFNSPFKSEVYFVNTKQFTDMKWGTANPVMLRDADFGMVRLRAFGTYSLRVASPQIFIKEIAGTNAHFQTEDIEGQLKRAIVSGFSDSLGELKIAALDLAAKYEELGGVLKAKINEDFATFGVEVTKFYVENISLPPEVEAAIDKRSSMGALGDAQKYMQFQAADALRDAAQNEGGGAGLGAGLGAGFAVGGQMANVFGNVNQPNQPQSGVGAAQPPTQNVDVSVSIQSEPTGADIEIDGSYEGNTPTQTMLAPGEYVIRVARPGFKAWERRVMIKAGSAKTFNAILEQE
jgi:membrane protease subunit (stomatin/prohibitin family)